MRYGNALMFANPGAAMTQGFAQATQMKEMGRQNALSDLYQEQGAGIASGDPNALAQLAQLDPMAARSVQRENASDARAVEMLGFARDRARREAEAWAKSVSAEEAGAAAAKVQSILEAGTVLYKQGDRDGYYRYLHQNGLDPVEYPFEDLPMSLAKLKGYEEGFAPFAAPKRETAKDIGGRLRYTDDGSFVFPDAQPPEPKPADEYQRYVQEMKAAGREPLDRIGYAQAKKGQGLSITTPDGLTITQGGATNIDPVPKMTVDAAKNSGFLIRTQEANKVLNDLEDEGLNFWQQNADKVPLGLGNYFREPEFQKFDQARRDFVNAILRRESGAVISEQEFENANIQYFPVPGDSPEVIAQKRRNRETAIQGLRVGSGPGAEYVDQLSASEAAIAETQGEPSVKAFDGEMPDFLSDQDKGLWEYMTTEERAAIVQTYGDAR